MARRFEESLWFKRVPEISQREEGRRWLLGLFVKCCRRVMLMEVPWEDGWCWGWCY